MGNGGLSQRDLRAILDFLRANYALKGHDGFVSNVVHGLLRVIASDLTAYCEIDPVRQTSTNWLDRPDVDTPEAARIWETYMLEMPVVSHYLETGDGRALRVTDFISQRQFRDTGVYTEHYHPKRLDYVVATWVPSKRSAIGIGLHRDRRDFSDNERLVLELLRPHLIQAWRNAELVTKLERESRLGQALSGLHPDIAVLDAQGTPLFVGARARQLLEKHFGRTGPDGAIPEDVARWARRRTADLARHTDDLPSRQTPLHHDADGSRLTVRSFVRGSDLVLAVEERRPLDPPRLRALGLTKRETEVLAWVAEGKTNDDIAGILDCAPKTVEKHLEHIYQKLDVSNRAAAVAAAFATSLEPA